MKVVMIYDQIQSGAGIKDDHMLPLGIKKEAVGPAIMMESFLKKIDARVVACLYCGDGYYQENSQEVSRKLCAMVEKIQPDVVMCGPAFDYLVFAQMVATVADDIYQTTKIPTLAAMAVQNEATIEAYKDKIHIIKTPKKGGTGLNESLEAMCLLAKALVDKTDTSEITSKYCF